VLSKIIEKAVHKQVSSYLLDHNLFDLKQSGFRAGHSTATALANITDDIYSNMDNGEITCSVLLDFSKAFDLVNHELLLRKLGSLNFSAKAIMFFRAYLSGRQQCVYVKNVCSRWVPVCTGVPQGSILGPLLFTVFINDLPKCLNVCSYHLYADDLQIYLSGPVKNINMIIENINEELTAVWNWSQTNLLKLNPDKTQAILIGTSQQLNKLPTNVQKINLNGNIVDYSHCVRNLGLQVDENLKWDKHISYICSTVYLKLKSLYYHRKFLSSNMRKRLVQALVIPIIDYADIVYGSTSTSNMQRIGKCYNSCIRYIAGLRKYDHVSSAIQELQLLTPKNRHDLHIACLTNKVLRTGCPLYLKKLNFLSNTESHDTRNHSILRVPKHKHEFFKHSFKYNSVTVWNELPNELRLLDDCLNFSAMARKHFIHKQSLSIS
jgi:hypothetical protein